MSRDTMYGSVTKNFGETLFTGLYGLIGASLICRGTDNWHHQSSTSGCVSGISFVG